MVIFDNAHSGSSKSRQGDWPSGVFYTQICTFIKSFPQGYVMVQFNNAVLQWSKLWWGSSLRGAFIQKLTILANISLGKWYKARPQLQWKTNRNPYAGASTPYKQWSKCTMEKVGGNVFFRNLGGSALIINTLPLSFCKNVMINFSAN